MRQISRLDHFHARWIRITLNTYWLVLLLTIVCSGLNILLVPAGNLNRQNPHLYFTIIGIQFIIVLACEFVHRFCKRYFMTSMIFLGALLASTVCIMNKEPGIVIVLILPILVPTFVGQNNKTSVSLATAAALISYCLILLFDPEMHSKFDINNFVLFVSLMISFAFLTFGIQKRGNELLEIIVSSFHEMQKIESDAKRDALTGLFNQRHFRECLDLQFEELERSPYPLFLLLLDIDSFKQVNDTYGHLVGDHALRYVGAVIQNGLEGNARAFRYGGEEFAVLLSHCTVDDTLRMANDLRQDISRQAHPEMNGEHLTVSMGVSLFRPGVKKEAVFAEADACLYEAKRSGKNKVMIHKNMAEPLPNT